MGFDWLKNKRNQQKQIKEKFLSQKSEIISEKITPNAFAQTTWVCTYLVTVKRAYS